MNRDAEKRVRKKLNLLLVDDDEGLCKMLKKILSWSKNREVFTAYSAEEASVLLERHRFALVIADYRLKGEKNGLEILYSAKAKDPNVITILITGYGSTQLAIRAVAEGVYDYLTKPFQSILEVRNTVDRGLRYYQLLSKYNEKVANAQLQKELLQETLEKARRTKRILRMLVDKLQNR